MIYRDFREFWEKLNDLARDRFISDTGITRAQISTSYLPLDPLKRKRPSNKRIAEMINASRDRMSVESLQEYFCGQAARKHLSMLNNEENPQ